jgi:hypothetical protein
LSIEANERRTERGVVLVIFITTAAASSFWLSLMNEASSIRRVSSTPAVMAVWRSSSAMVVVSLKLTNGNREATSAPAAVSRPTV